MSSPVAARTRLQQAADAQAAIAVAAAAAANASPAAAAAAAPPGTAADQTIALLVAQMQQQHLDAQAQLAQSAADTAARAAAAEAALAQQRAGAAPLFHGKASSIEAHRWLTAIERWFAAAHIDATEEATRIEIATSSLRDAAQAWWATNTANGTAATLGTWARFSAEVRKRFLPLDVVRWAMREREALVSGKNRNVVDYTAKFTELDQLLPDEAALARVLAYERGLPADYAVKCAERRFDSLAAATEAMTTLWHAKESARPATVSVSNAEASEQHQRDDSASSSSASGPARALPAADSVDELRAQVAQLTAMMSQQLSSAGRGRGRSGRGRGRPQQRNEGESQRRERSRTPGLSDELVRARIRAGQCIKCGQEGHFKQECTNEAKLN
jgi:hypothetical protein